jgi:hypothetical protein
MKKMLAGYLFLFAASGAFMAQAQEKDPDQFIQKLWIAVKNSDDLGYVKLFPDYKQTRDLFSELVKNMKDSLSRAGMEEYINNFTETQFQKEFMSPITKDFSRFLVNARAKGIDLNALHFESSVYEIAKTDQFAFGTKTMKGIIYLKNDTTEYEFSLQSLWNEAQQSWFGANLGMIKKKGEKEEIVEEIISDTAVTTVDVVEPPPPPPKKTKVKITTTKSSPARKTKTRS